MKNSAKLCFFIAPVMFVMCLFAADSEVTKSTIEEHTISFFTYIDEQSDRVWKLQWIPTDWAAKKAVKVEGYDGFSYECIKATYPFFKRIKDKKYLTKIMAALSEHVGHINTIVQRHCSEKPADGNSLFRITHEETIKCAPLPESIDKQELFKSHAKCKKVAHYIKTEDQDILIIAGLFAKYWVEEVKN